jgi:DNA (cytosine-5)-methyltransferase 1
VSGVYYNDNDPFVCAWLRNLIAAGHLPAGDVDERSIEEVSPDDVRGYTQAHFFAGIGGWPYALQLAGWDGPVWTGSCPCQPLSGAGQRKGHADQRHLWPAFHRLIAQCKPPVVFGEQVASKDGREWLAGVRADLEDLGYAVGAADLCAAGVGAPHIRQRLFWVADRESARLIRTVKQSVYREDANGRDSSPDDARAGGSDVCGLADAEYAERRTLGIPGEDGRNGSDSGRPETHGEPRTCGEVRGLADAERGAAEHRGYDMGAAPGGAQEEARERERFRLNPWASGVLIPCRDGKARRVEPGIFPLAHGVPNRLGTLRGSGNAIVPQVAAAFVSAYMDAAAPPGSAPQ